MGIFVTNKKQHTKAITFCTTLFFGGGLLKTDE